MRGFFSFAVFIIAISILMYFSISSISNSAYSSDDSYFMSVLLFEESYANLHSNFNEFLKNNSTSPDSVILTEFNANTNFLDIKNCSIISKQGNFTTRSSDVNIVDATSTFLVHCLYGSISADKNFTLNRSIHRVSKSISFR